MHTPISGFRYLLDGFQLITQPGLRRFVVIPLIINIILFAILFLVAKHFMTEFNHWFANYLPAWLHWLSTILWIVFLLSFFLVFVFAFVTVGNILCAPFNSFLAEKVEFYLTGKLPDSRGIWGNIKDIPRIIARQFSILIYFVPRATLIVLLLLIPVVQTFVALIWFLFHAWMMAMTYLDYPTDNHRISMPAVRDWMGSNRIVTFSFGIGVLVASMIPVVNFFTIPAAVAGATKLWVLSSRKM